jgi:hypothetical protein
LRRGKKNKTKIIDISRLATIIERISLLGTHACTGYDSISASQPWKDLPAACMYIYGAKSTTVIDMRYEVFRPKMLMCLQENRHLVRMLSTSTPKGKLPGGHL